MRVSNKIHVLSAFDAYLRLFSAYDCNNFRDNNWQSISHYVCSVFCVTTIAILLPIFVSLSIWNLIENEENLEKIVVALPILLTFTQMEISFIVMIIKNRTTTATISQLQRVVDQREFLICPLSAIHWHMYIFIE